MPLYMDVHSLDGAVTFEDVGKAHQADLQTQGSHDVSYLRYWVDGRHGKIFCLVEAPNAEAASAPWVRASRVSVIVSGIWLFNQRSARCCDSSTSAPKPL